jgi:hypothetical protein
LKGKAADSMIRFSVPQYCPTTSKLICLSANSQELEKVLVQNVQDTEEEMWTVSLGDTSPTKLNIFPKLSVSTSAMQQKRKLTKAPLVVSKVRSERLKGKKSGD